LAQQGSSIELGGFGAYTFFDSSLSFDDGIGAGGWLGFYLLSRLSLEGEASYTTADWNGATISYVPFRARLVYSQPVSGNFAFLLGAGFVHNEYSKDIQGADNGVTGLVGFRLGFAGPLALRVSGAADYILKPANEEDSNLNIGVQAGLSVTLGPLFGRAAGARPRAPGHRGASALTAAGARCRRTATGTASSIPTMRARTRRPAPGSTPAVARSSSRRVPQGWCWKA
jgi:hypothetical protein